MKFEHLSETKDLFFRGVGLGKHMYVLANKEVGTTKWIALRILLNWEKQFLQFENK